MSNIPMVSIVSVISKHTTIERFQFFRQCID